MATSSTPSGSRCPSKHELLVNRKKKKTFRRRIPEKKPEDSKPNWLDLPPDLTASIFRRIGSIVDRILNVPLVCTSWYNISMNPSMWRTLKLRCESDRELNWEKVYSLAVNLSGGQLVEINVDAFCNEGLLKHISDRSNQLRHLELYLLYEDVSVNALVETVKKLPLLEHLVVYYFSVCKRAVGVGEEAIVEIGRCCPLLNTLKLFYCENGSQSSADMEAMTIARSMPELRHLTLLESNLTNVGLQAILDGCKNLESLQLTRCYNLDLSGALLKRCEEQIKHLATP